MQRVWENNVLSPFSRHFVQSSQKMRKISVFCATLCKKCEKTVFFSRFLRYFVQSSQKRRKISVFCAFSATFEKTVFFHVFQDTLYKVRRKWAKSAFFEHFLRRSQKKCEETVFFHVFRDTLKKVWKNAINIVFWAFCSMFRKKCEKTLFFSRFSKHFVQSSQKMLKNSVFWAFSASFREKCEKTVLYSFFPATFRKKCEKTVFFHVFRDNLCKVRKKNEKRTLFARRSAKSVRKLFFSRFLRHFVQSLQKKAFFLRDVLQKVWVFFHVFQDSLYKVRRKLEKWAFFEFFLRRSPKSVRKQCFFMFFETLCTKFT